MSCLVQIFGTPQPSDPSALWVSLSRKISLIFTSNARLGGPQDPRSEVEISLESVIDSFDKSYPTNTNDPPSVINFEVISRL